MVLILRLMYSQLVGHFQISGSDPRTRDLPLIASYPLIIAILSSYLLVVFKIGPHFMAKRRPYKIKSIIQTYNILQILLNVYIFAGVTKYFLLHSQYNWFCMRHDKTDFSSETIALLHYTYLYYLSKIIDLMDTIFFILRKKSTQVSFLHVYHHTAMVWAGFIYHNTVFGSQFTVIGYVNSFVHILMYAYYFFAALDTNLNLDSWKPRMTQIQILQFFYFSVKLGVSIMDNWCGLPIFWLFLAFVQNLFMTVMFSHFYWKNYVVKDKKK